MTPVTAFITFEKPFGSHVASAYHELHQTNLKSPWGQKLLGFDLKLYDASEPTDIIWENRHFTEE